MAGIFFAPNPQRGELGVLKKKKFLNYVTERYNSEE